MALEHGLCRAMGAGSRSPRSSGYSEAFDLLSFVGDVQFAGGCIDAMHATLLDCRGIHDLNVHIIAIVFAVGDREQPLARDWQVVRMMVRLYDFSGFSVEDYIRWHKISSSSVSVSVASRF